MEADGQNLYELYDFLLEGLRKLQTPLRALPLLTGTCTSGHAEGSATTEPFCCHENSFKLCFALPALNYCLTSGAALLQEDQSLLGHHSPSHLCWQEPNAQEHQAPQVALAGQGGRPGWASSSI